MEPQVLTMELFTGVPLTDLEGNRGQAGWGAFQKMLSFFLSYAMGEGFSHRIHRLAEVVLDAQNGGRSETSNL